LDGEASTEVEGEMSTMRAAFPNSDKAKKYLIGLIAEQAKLEQTPLSDAEEKMLYFSVDGPSVADDVANQFDDDCPEYEQRITDLIRRRYEREKQNGDGGDADRMVEAARVMANEDHYLNVMMSEALNRGSLANTNKPWLQAAYVLGPLVLLGLLIVFWDRLW
jgi:hypothetical protein